MTFDVSLVALVVVVLVVGLMDPIIEVILSSSALNVVLVENVFTSTVEYSVVPIIPVVVECNIVFLVEALFWVVDWCEVVFVVFWVVFDERVESVFLVAMMVVDVAV